MPMTSAAMPILFSQFAPRTCSMSRGFALGAAGAWGADDVAKPGEACACGREVGSAGRGGGVGKTCCVGGTTTVGGFGMVAGGCGANSGGCGWGMATFGGASCAVTGGVA